MICIFLALATLVVYWQILDHDFLTYDDDQYVTQNKQLKQEISSESIIWAFTTNYASNWHPVTWLSHMLDYQNYGSDPRGHHLSSLLFHIANALLLFAVLNRMTGALWQSAFVSALFALHPLNVDSVASDPWPKRRHAKKRFVQEKYMQLVAHVLLPGGGLSLRTDDRNYANQMVEVLGTIPRLQNLADPGPFATSPRVAIPTLYQERWTHEGRTIHFLEFEKQP